MFAKFFANVVGRGKKPEKSVEYDRAFWYFGYMLHRFKDPSLARAWVLYDIKVGNSGGSGKSLIGLALSKIRYTTIIDGKQIDFRNRFWLQTVKPWTEIIFIDDPRINTSIVPMFNMITNGVVADRKGLQPLEIDVKFLFASNWLLEMSTSSESRRQFISQLDDFYLRYAQDKGNIAQPVLHYHKKLFFTDWDKTDWAQFDTFAVQALQHYFKNPTPEDIIVGNTQALHFAQKHGEEMYSELHNLFDTRANKAQGYIPRDILIAYIRDKDNTINAKNAGQIARDFLKSLGIKEVKVSTVRERGLLVNVYSWDVKSVKI
jgi:hypothetical protein